MAERPDIAAAVSRMSTKLGAGREIKRLESHLWDDEQVETLASGNYASTNGLLALTDRRVLFIAEGVVKKSVEDFPLDRITSVQWKGAMIMGTLTIFAAGNKAEFKNVNKGDGKAISDQIRARSLDATSSRASAVPVSAAAAPMDLADQLRKLADLRDSGVLTDEEFAAQKAKLLG